MNETETTHVNKEDSMLPTICNFMNYILNKYMPLIMVTFICFYSFGYETWEPFAVFGLMIFSNSFNFKCGYAHCCVDNNIEDTKND